MNLNPYLDTVGEYDSRLQLTTSVESHRSQTGICSPLLLDGHLPGERLALLCGWLGETEKSQAETRPKRSKRKWRGKPKLPSCFEL